MVLKVGLTGGIGSGKSTVLDHFQSFGCFTCDADSIVHTLYRTGSDIYDRLVKAFSREILDARGDIDRNKLGALIFTDAKKRFLLNEIVHPAVFAEEEKLLSQYSSRVRDGIAVVDAALMIESGSYTRYHRIVLVVADREIRLNRLLSRHTMSSEEALQRMDSQMPDQEKKKFAHYVIENDGTLEALETNTRAVYHLLQKDRQGPGEGHV